MGATRARHGGIAPAAAGPPRRTSASPSWRTGGAGRPGRRAGPSQHDRLAIQRLIRVKRHYDQPQPFIEGSWLAVPGADQAGIIDLLGLSAARPATFALGLSAVANDAHGWMEPRPPRPERSRVFITPQLDGWTLVVGEGFLPAGRREAELLRVCRRVGGRYGIAQAFTYHELSGWSAWTVADDHPALFSLPGEPPGLGRIVRHHVDGDNEQAGSDIGAPLPAELAFSAASTTVWKRRRDGAVPSTSPRRSASIPNGSAPTPRCVATACWPSPPIASPTAYRPAPCGSNNKPDPTPILVHPATQIRWQQVGIYLMGSKHPKGTKRYLSAGALGQPWLRSVGAAGPFLRISQVGWSVWQCGGGVVSTRVMTLLIKSGGMGRCAMKRR